MLSQSFTRNVIWDFCTLLSLRVMNDTFNLIQTKILREKNIKRPLEIFNLIFGGRDVSFLRF